MKPQSILKLLVAASLVSFIACRKDVKLDNPSGLAPDTVAPTVPVSTVTVGSVTSSGAQFSWTAATDGKTASSALKYKIVKASSAAAIDTIQEADAVGASDVVMDWVPGTTSKNVTGLAGSTTYHFAVLVCDAAGNKTLYSLTSFTTLTPDLIAPTLTSTTVATSNVSDIDLDLSWSAASDNVSIASHLKYKIVKATSSTLIDTIAEADAYSAGLVMDWASATTSYTVSGLTPSTAYHFAVLVKDEAQNMTLYSLASATTLAPIILDVTKFTPANTDIEVDLTKPVEITFNAKVDPATINTTNIEISHGSTPIAGTFSYDAPTKKVTFTPAADYPQGAVITVKVKASILRVNGASPSTDRTASFTTLDLSRLIALWRFDGNTDDSSGNNRHLTRFNTTYDTSNKSQGSSSIYLNGTNAYLTAGVLNLGSTFTVTVWVYLPNPVKASINTLISNGLPGVDKNGFKLFINTWMTSDLAVVTEAGNGTQGGLLKTADNFVSTGSWKHFAFVIDKTQTPANRALIYFNGTLSTQTYSGANGSTAFQNDFSTNAVTDIGRFPDSTFYYKGNMDDFRIYNGVLPPGDIAKIATQE